MKILMIAHEFPPYGSGIANAACALQDCLSRMGPKIYTLSQGGASVNLYTPFRTSPGLISLIPFWRQAVDYAIRRSSDYDVLWLHSPMLLSARRLKDIKKVIITFHSTYYGFYKSQRAHGVYKSLLYYLFASKLENNFLRQLSKFRHRVSITAVSQSVANELKENGLSIRMVRANELESIGMRGDGVRYIANGVDVYKFKPVKHRKRLRKELGFPQNDLLILSVGRISQIKNPASLIDIFSLLEKYCRQVTLIIVGGGENENGLRELVDRKGVRNVIFLGFVQHEKIAKVYACADVYIISSIYEGASPPLTLAEALASGLPCIVSNVPSLASVITDANAGIVIDFSNKTNAAKQIVEYIHNREERLEHAVNARAYAVKNLDWVRIAQKYLKELQRL